MLSLRTCLLGTMVVFCFPGDTIAADAPSYLLDFSTYFGGSGWEHARDIATDSDGNIYIVGGTASADFPTTEGAYDRSFDSGYDGALGPCDAFVSKFDSSGQLIWSTLLGGYGYDRAYGVEVDASGYVYVAGRAGTGFPTTGGFQTTFQGELNSSSYGWQNAFVAKLQPDGSDLVWASYVGVSALCRDIAIDGDGDIYVPGGRLDSSLMPPASWFTNAYQAAPQGGHDGGIIKIKGDGSQVLWATWLGGSGNDSSEASIRVDGNKEVYIALQTASPDMPTTAGAFARSHTGSGVDFYVAKVNSEGSDLVYGTYIGGSANEWMNTHNLAIDDAGNAYVSMGSGADFPVTAGSVQTVHGGGQFDWGIAKISPTGSLLASTLLGGNGDDNPDGLSLDSAGNVYISGETDSTDFPLTQGAYQTTKGSGIDSMVAVLSADFSELLYSTYMGGESYDNGRASCLDANGNFYLTGSSDGTGWPVKDALQSSFAGGVGQCCGMGDAIIAKFISVPGSKKGDFNADGVVDLVDLLVTLQTMAGGATVYINMDADPDDDDKIGLDDAVYVLRQIAH